MISAPATTGDPSPATELAPGSAHLSFWQDGTNVEIAGQDLWQRVARSLDVIEAHPELGHFVLIVSRTNPDMMALFLALIAARRLVSFFPTASPLQDERSFFAQQRAALASINPSSIVIFDPAHADTIATIDPRLAGKIVMPLAASRADGGFTRAAGQDGERALARFHDALMAGPDRALFIQHSSGTTGIKKAVSIDAPALRAQFASYWPAVRRMVGADVRVATWLPLYHDMGLLAGFLLPLMGGAAISIIDPFEWIARPGSLFDMIEHDSSNVCWLPNFAFRHLTRMRKALPERRLASVRAWVNCSEPCRYRDAREFERAFADHGVAPASVAGCYAMAETVFAVTQLEPREQRALVVRRDVAIGDDLRARSAEVIAGPPPAGDSGCSVVQSSGRTLPGIDVRIFIDGKPALRDGLYGEIGVRGAFVFRGYRGLSWQDSGIGEDGYYRTGDLGALIDGHLYVFGRVKEIIIVNGKNIFAGDVEEIVNAVSGVKKGRVVAFGMENEQSGSEDLIIVAEREDSSIPADDELRAAITRLVFDAFLIQPRDVRLVTAPWLVKSTSGKISRRENRFRYIEAFHRPRIDG